HPRCGAHESTGAHRRPRRLGDPPAHQAGASRAAAAGQPATAPVRGRLNSRQALGRRYRRGEGARPMKRATTRDGSREGRVIVVRRDGEVGAPAPDAWPTLQRALDDWAAAEPALRAVAGELDAGNHDGMPIDPLRLDAPLPRAYEWVD